MAQTGYTPIQVYSSATASATPLAVNLAAGELAINTLDEKLYFKNSSGVVKLLASNAASGTSFSGGTTGLTPSSPTTGAVVLAGTLAVANGGTGVTSSTGTGNTVLSTSPALVTPALGTPTALVGTNITGTAAAFNINGTVGATTPAAGTFTAVTASSDSTFSSTGAITVSKGTTAQRPASPVSGMFRFNTTTTEFEGYNGTAFASVGGAALSNDTTTATNLFPLFATATSGSASSLFTSNAQYLFKPSTGELSVKTPIASNGIVVNSATVSASYTIASGNNAMSTGPITINSGIVVTVPTGSRWVVL